MRTLGVDLAITGTHKAVVVDEQGNAIGSVMRFRTDPAELDVVVRQDGRIVSRPEPEPVSDDQDDGFIVGFNVAFNAPERIFVRGRGLESEWGGGLDIEGTSKALEIVGSIDFRRGFLSFLDQRFTIHLSICK